MKKIITLLTITLFSLTLFSQNYQWQWAKAGGSSNKLHADETSPLPWIYNTVNYHEEVVSLKNTSDNNTYVLSHLSHGNSNYAGTPFNTYHRLSSTNYFANVFLGKVDCEGNYLWHKVFGGSGGENSHSIGIDAFDNVFVGMRVWNRGFHDTLVNIAGLAYERPVHFDNDTIMDPIPRNWGGVVLFDAPSAAHKTLALIKYNSEGQFQWLRMPQNDSLTILTNSAGDFGVHVESNGNVHWLVALGNGIHFDGLINVSGLENQQYKFYILKYDTNGNIIGYVAIPFDQTTGFLYEKRVNFTYDPLLQRYYFTLNRDTNDSIYQIIKIGNQEYLASVLICFDANGQVLWTKTANNTWSALVQGLLVDDQSNIYVSGKGSSTTIFEPNNAYGPENGNFGGYQFTNNYSRQPFLIKFDSQANLLWGTNASGTGGEGVGGSGSEAAIGMSINGDEIAVGTGFINNTWGQFGVTGQAMGDGTDSVLARFNKHTGAIIGLHRIHGPRPFEEGLTAVETDKDGNYLVGGYFTSFLFADYNDYVDPIVGQLNKAAPGSGADFFIAKLAKNTCNYVSTENFNQLDIKVYPNPTTANVYFETTENLATYEVYNILGQRLLSNSFNGDNSISLETLAAGTYFIKVTTDQNTQATVKVIKS